MSEEIMQKSSISATSETIKPKANVRRNSTGIITLRSSSPLSSGGIEVPSRYMRASIGSCHDLCKYGRRHISEEEKQPFLCSLLGDNAKSNGKKNLPRSSMEETERPMAELKDASSQKAGLANNPEVTEKKTLSPANGIDACEEPNIIKKKNASPAKKSMNLVAPKVNKQKTPPSFKTGSTFPAVQVMKHNPASALKTAAKPSISFKANTSIMKPTTSLNPSGAGSGQRFKENNISNSLCMAKVGETKVSKSPMASLSLEVPLGNVKHASSVWNQDVGEPEYSDTGIMERTLHVIEPLPDITDMEHSTSSLSDKVEETDESVLISSETDASESEDEQMESSIEISRGKESVLISSETDESESEDEQMESSIKISRGKDMIRQRRSVTVHSEDKFIPPRKLKFRRGKVVEIQVESNAPKRLRFRKRRMLNENLECNSQVVSISPATREFDGAVLNASTSESQSVVLRHQGIEEKQDAQGLFNRVIEETASKLVKTRKSKVKALVGAFEAVISLQESKPASAV